MQGVSFIAYSRIQLLFAVTPPQWTGLVFEVRLHAVFCTFTSCSFRHVAYLCWFSAQFVTLVISARFLSIVSLCTCPRGHIMVDMC